MSDGIQFLNQVIEVITERPNGTMRIQQDFSNCPSMAEQHTAHHTNINYLISKYKPDELAAYMAARAQYRQEILGHDFSQEVTLQEAKNVVYRSKSTFDALPDDLKMQFKNHVEFLKYLDNPENVVKLKKLKLLNDKQIADLQSMEVTSDPKRTKTEDEDDKESKKPVIDKATTNA